MPRDPGTGVYTLPLPPTEPRRIPVTGWANTTVEDLAAAMNNIPGTALAPYNLRVGTLPGVTPNAQPNIEIGRTDGTPALPHIDFHAGAVTTDYDARIICSTGTGVAGEGDMTILATPLTLGKGQLQFPATQNPSSNANTLDDYEEGTFTPSFTFATPGNLSVVYDARVGEYVKVGRMVTVAIQIRATTFTHTTASGIFQLTGLPFLTAGPVCCGSSSYMRGFVTGADTQIAFHTSGAFITGVFSNNSTGSISGMTPAHVASGSNPYLILTLTYFTST